MNQFQLLISLGDDAMRTAEDVAGALRLVAEDIAQLDFRQPDRGHIADLNGNTVGTWRVI